MLPIRSIVGALLLGVVAAASAGPLEDARQLSAEGQNEAALTEVRRALERDANDPSALLFEGVLLSRLGRIDEAIDRFERLNALRPDLPEPYNNLAVLFAGRGEYEKARAALVEAVRLQPEYDLAHENLGDVYTQLAAESYRRAAESNADNARARDKARANERILGDARIVRSNPPTAAGNEAVAASEQQCLRIAGLTSRARAEEVERWLEARNVNGAFERVGQAGGETHRVYVGPMAHADAADGEAARLRDRGVKDLQIIRSGELANGISLGVFSSRRNAERQLVRMTRLGVDARIVSDANSGTARYVVSAAVRSDELDRADILDAFPEASVSFAPCRS